MTVFDHIFKLLCVIFFTLFLLFELVVKQGLSCLNYFSHQGWVEGWVHVLDYMICLIREPLSGWRYIKGQEFNKEYMYSDSEWTVICASVLQSSLFLTVINNYIFFIVIQVAVQGSERWLILSQPLKLKAFKKNLKMLLESQPDGTIALGNFVSTYMKFFGQKCKIATFGFSKLTDLIEAVPKVAKVSFILFRYPDRSCIYMLHTLIAGIYNMPLKT